MTTINYKDKDKELLEDKLRNDSFSDEGSEYDSISDGSEEEQEEENSDEENEEDEDIEEDENKDEDIDGEDPQKDSVEIIEDFGENILNTNDIYSNKAKIEDIDNVDNADVDNDDDDDDDENYEKLENCFLENSLENLHPEIKNINFEEIKALTKIVRDENGSIIDPLHTTIPFLTKYEKARILGSRAEQLDNGAMPFIDIPDNVINGKTIALMEFEKKKIPYIIARPLPNKGIEYWNMQDLEVL